MPVTILVTKRVIYKSAKAKKLRHIIMHIAGIILEAFLGMEIVTQRMHATEFHNLQLLLLLGVKVWV